MKAQSISHSNSNHSAHLSHLEEKVFEKRPVLGETYRQYGDLSLLEFTRRQFDIPKNEHIAQERKDEVITVIAEQAEKILGVSIAHSVSAQLQEQYIVNTTDHHGTITDTGFVSSNLLNSFYLIHESSNNKENIIVLSNSNVSFDNISFPRGHLFHSLAEQEVMTNELVFFPSKVRQRPVFNHASYTEQSILDAKKRIDTWVQNGIIKEKQKKQLYNLLDEIYAKPSVLALKKFSDQVTLTNYLLWHSLFSSYREQPNLIYLEAEQIVNTLILNHHLSQETIIHKFLFDEAFAALTLKYFDGISGAFSLHNHSGTYLFWALPKNQKYRLALWKKGNRLVSEDESYSVELKAEVIAQAIRDNELIPGTLLSYILLAFYYGMCLIGGGSQTTYLTEMKKAYITLCKDSGNEEEIEFCRRVPTDRQAIPYPGLAFLKSANPEKIPATTVDLLLYGNTDCLSVIEEMTRILTVKDVLARALAHMYQFLFSKENQQKGLLDISEKDIDKMTGFTVKLKACGQIY